MPIVQLMETPGDPSPSHPRPVAPHTVWARQPPALLGVSSRGELHVRVLMPRIRSHDSNTCSPSGKDRQKLSEPDHWRPTTGWDNENNLRFLYWAASHAAPGQRIFTLKLSDTEVIFPRNIFEVNKNENNVSTTQKYLCWVHHKYPVKQCDCRS